MKLKYYKPTGPAVVAVMDWMIARKNVLEKWHKFTVRFCLEETDLRTEHGVVVGLTDEPPVRLPFDIDDKIARLPALPDDSILADMLGIHGTATAVKTRGGLVVKCACTLKDGTLLTDAVLAKDYGIRTVVGECAECGLPLSYNELECGRCGTPVQPEQKEVSD
jgi:hypothetical protein